MAGACSDGGGGGTRTITATDYRFDGLPSSVKAGTKLVLTNASTKEVHELVAMRLADTEKRSADELVKLPDPFGQRHRAGRAPRRRRRRPRRPPGDTSGRLLGTLGGMPVLIEGA